MSNPYGVDGVPHLAYYDPGSSLSFVADPFHLGRVGVHHGGYGEPLVDEFLFNFEPVAGISEHLRGFHQACQTYVRAWRTSQRVQHFDGEVTE